METLRTPAACFDDLADFSFEPHYVEIDDLAGATLRVHHLDEGPKDGPVVLLLHGEPSWSYLYRHMIPPLADAGFRCIAPDLVGFGRSDKPTLQSDFSYARHVAWLRAHIFEALDLSSITLFCQDWGGILGLCLLPDHGDRFARGVASNTGLPEGRGMNKFMEDWLAFSQSVDVLPVGALVQGGSTRELTAAELAAYDAPYPDGSFQVSPKRFPLLIPLQPDNPGTPRAEATWAFLETWEKPFLTIFGDQDAVAYKSGAQQVLRSRIPGAAGQHHLVLEGPSHFIQEDAPDELVAAIDGCIRDATG